MPVPKTPRSTERVSLADVAYEQIRDAIVHGQLQPGERLHDAELTRWLGVSRMPVRQAIEKLADHGLVEMVPNAYTRVAEADTTSYLELWHVVAALYRRAIVRVLPRLDDRQIAEACALIEDSRQSLHASPTLGDDPQSVQAVLAPGAFFVSKTSNGMLRQMVDALNARLAFLMRVTPQPFDLTMVDAYFDRLSHAVRDRDARDAADAVRTLAFDSVARVAGRSG